MHFHHLNWLMEVCQSFFCWLLRSALKNLPIVRYWVSVVSSKYCFELLTVYVMFKLGSGYSLSSWRVQFWSFPPGLISITKAANMNAINLSAQSQVLTQTFMFHSGEGIDPTGPMHHNISTSTKSVGKYRDLNFTTMGCSPDFWYMRESNKNRLFGTWLVP